MTDETSESLIRGVADAEAGRVNPLPWVTAADPSAVLACPMRPEGNEVGTTTVGGYLVSLLAALWTQGSDFSGKRPFGGGSWEQDVFVALGDEGLIRLVRDEDGDVVDYDEDRGRELVAEAIETLRMGLTARPLPGCAVRIVYDVRPGSGRRAR